MIQERTWLLIARKLASEATSEEQIELAKLVLNNPALQNVIDMLSSFWSNKEDMIEMGKLQSMLARIRNCDDGIY